MQSYKQLYLKMFFKMFLLSNFERSPKKQTLAKGSKVHTEYT